MSARFQMNLRKSHGNLHINPRGDFNGSSAWELVNLLHEQYDGKGGVFIDTNSLRDMCPFGCGIFKTRLNTSVVPANRIFFKGKNGFKIAPDGSKVILTQRDHKRCKCNRKCTNCKCGEMKRENSN